MQSNLSFFKKSRQQLRTLAKDIMSSSDYATYINEESAWENQVDENILSIKNILFSTHQNATSDMARKIEEEQNILSIVEEPSLTSTSEKVPSDKMKEDLLEGNNEIISQELFIHEEENTNVEDKKLVEDIVEKLVDINIDNEEKNITEKISENSISADTPKPFHMKIQNSKPKKRRRSIFRRKKKNKPEVIRTLAREQSLHSFSDGIRNIISQVSNSKDVQTQDKIPISSDSLDEKKPKEISKNKRQQDLFVDDSDVKNRKIKEFNEPSHVFHVNQVPQTDDSILFDVLEEKQDILDADSLDLDLNVDMFHDLPPPIPEYFDTESTKEVSLEHTETFLQPLPDTKTQIERLNNDSSLSEKPKDIAYYTNQLLIESSISKRVELFIGRLSIHLQEQHWLEGSSDAFMILVLDASQRKRVVSIMESYDLPTVYQDRIKSNFKF